MTVSEGRAHHVEGKEGTKAQPGKANGIFHGWQVHSRVRAASKEESGKRSERSGDQEVQDLAGNCKNFAFFLCMTVCNII